MSQKTIQITKSELMNQPKGKSDNIIISSEFKNLLKRGKKPTKKIMVKKRQNKKYVSKKSKVVRVFIDLTSVSMLKFRPKIPTIPTKTPRYYFKIPNQKGFNIVGYTFAEWINPNCNKVTRSSKN